MDDQLHIPHIHTTQPTLSCIIVRRRKVAPPSNCQVAGTYVVLNCCHRLRSNIINLQFQSLFLESFLTNSYMVLDLLQIHSHCFREFLALPVVSALFRLGNLFSMKVTSLDSPQWFYQNLHIHVLLNVRKIVTSVDSLSAQNPEQLLEYMLKVIREEFGGHYSEQDDCARQNAMRKLTNLAICDLRKLSQFEREICRYFYKADPNTKVLNTLGERMLFAHQELRAHP